MIVGQVMSYGIVEPLLSSVQLVICFLYVAKPPTKPMLTYCQMDP